MSETINFDGLNFGFGWIEDPVEVKRVVTANGIQPFQTVAAACMGDTKPTKPVVLSRYMEEIWGKDTWIYNQGSCGSCVANGAGMAAEILVAQDIVENGAENPGHLDCMSIYWGSRVEIGGGSLWGQGSVGVWAAQWLQKFGCVVRKKYESVDLSEYSSSLCCSGYARKGVPEDVETVAKVHPVQHYAAIKTCDEAIAALCNGYPVTVASNQGFSNRRDENGFVRPQGRWPHQMLVIAYDPTDDSFVILNSWGLEWISGPKPDWMPEGSFKVKRATLEQMFRAGDSWALSNLKGWPRRKLNFLKLNW